MFAFEDVSIALGLLVALIVALEIGFRAGRWSASEPDAKAGAQVGAVQGAVLGLLGLLLGFSFSAAASRFMERQDLIVQEANAIGTAYLRADLIDDANAAGLRGALHAYTKHRIEESPKLRHGLSAESAAKIDQLQARIWAAARDGVNAKPIVALAVLDPVNQVIDLHTLRMAAGMKHLPYLVLWLLIACSALAVGVIGYGFGLNGKRRVPLTMPLAIVVCGALWITIDLDHPRAGLLRLSDAPLAALKFTGQER